MNRKSKIQKVRASVGLSHEQGSKFTKSSCVSRAQVVQNLVFRSEKFLNSRSEQRVLYEVAYECIHMAAYDVIPYDMKCIRVHSKGTMQLSVTGVPKTCAPCVMHSGVRSA